MKSERSRCCCVKELNLNPAIAVLAMENGCQTPRYSLYACTRFADEHFFSLHMAQGDERGKPMEVFAAYSGVLAEASIAIIMFRMTG